jgi:hypothetical protein
MQGAQLLGSVGHAGQYTHARFKSFKVQGSRFKVQEHVLELRRVGNRADGVTAVSSIAATIRAVAAGDQDAFSQLYADYVRLVHAILLGRVPRRDVDDLVQEVFIVAYRRIGELREQLGWRDE